MANATSITSPSPGLSATMLSNKSIVSYSPKLPENVKVDKKAMIRNRYNRIPHPAPNTKWEKNTYNYDGTKIKTPVGPTKDRASSPSQLNWKLYAGAISKSEARPAGVQLKRAAKLLTVSGLTTKHAVCRITFML